MKIKSINQLLTPTLLSLIVIMSCSKAPKPKSECVNPNCATISAPKGLTKIAETDTLLATPESVIYDSEKDVAYVANINGQPTNKDGNGFISIINLDGKIITREWVKGFDAPKGMGIYNRHLFVTDINQVVEIDIEKGEIVNRFVAEKAQFLNDIAIDAAGTVFISDMLTNEIYRLKDSKLELWLQSDKFKSINGLFIIENQLLAGTSNIIYSIDITTKELKEYITETGGIDGLESVGNNKFIVSDWTGNINIVSPNSPKELLLSTADHKINAADLDYILDKKLVLVPTFFDNRVMIYSYVE